MRILGTVASSSREVPNAPTIGTATDVGTARAYNNGAASVTFTAPSFDGGLPITSYTVTSSPGGFTASGASSPVTVTGLQSSTSYTFTVTATNSRGTGAASAASNSITATTVPQSPTIGTATAGNASATVTYTAGATGGKAVSVYTATSSPGSLTGTGASPITVSGLTNGTAYTFTVTATNANGTSAASAASNSITPVNPAAFESIATATGTGSSGIITFSSIPQTYTSLQIRAIVRSTQALNNQGDLQVYLNGVNSGSSYSSHSLYGTGSSATSTAEVGFTQMAIPNCVPLGNTATGLVGAIVLDFHEYTSTTKNKTIRALAGVDRNGAGAIGIHSGLYANTSATTSISIKLITGSWATNSTFALYGIKG
jgi:hypothetical protein